MAASMSSSFFLTSLSVARICWSTLDSFPLGCLLSFVATDVRLPIMFSLSGRCSWGGRWRRSCLVLLIGAPLEGSQYLGLLLPQPSLGLSVGLPAPLGEP